jgi:hypothetical protein
MSTIKRLSISFVALLALVLAVGLIVRVEPYYPMAWASIPSQDSDALTEKQKIRCALGESCLIDGKSQQVTDLDLLQENPVKIAALNTVAGTTVDISVILVRFELNDIKPTASWAKLLASLPILQGRLWDRASGW